MPHFRRPQANRNRCRSRRNKWPPRRRNQPRNHCRDLRSCGSKRRSEQNRKRMVRPAARRRVDRDSQAPSPDTIEFTDQRNCREDSNIMRSKIKYTSVVLLIVLAGSVVAQEPVLQALNVYPPDAHLTTVRDRQSLVVQATFADGTTRDVTKEAQFSLADAAVAKLEGNVLHPVTDGKTTLKV